MEMTIALLALGVGLVAFVYAWLLRRDLSSTYRRLDRYNRALFDANDQIRSLREEMAEKLATVQAQTARATGQAAFTPDMTIREVYALHPQAQEVLAGFHLGGCSSCAVEPDDRLDKICEASGVDVADITANLNMLLASAGSDKAANGVTHARLPNIELSV